MIGTDKVDDRECCAACQVVGIVVNVPNGVAIRDGACVESPVATTRVPAVVLGDEV